MLNLTSYQEEVLDSTAFEPSFLFEIIKESAGTYYKWSTKDVTTNARSIVWEDGIDWEEGGTYWNNGYGYIDGSVWEEDVDWELNTRWEPAVYNPEYTGQITNFDGIEMVRPSPESGIQIPSVISFTVIDSGGSLDPASFVDGYVNLSLSIKNSVTNDATIIGSWKYRIKSVDIQYYRLTFVCESYYSKYLAGYYPNTQYVEDIFPSNDNAETSGVCIPLPFGTAYVPLKSVYTSGARYYMLGPLTVNGSSVTYTIDAVHSPKTEPSSEWTSGSYSFTQSSKVDGDGDTWRVFQAIVNDSDNDGTADANALWLDGTIFKDMPTKFSRSDTSSITNPADVIQFILEDLGIETAYIDVDGTFAAAKATYTSWGLEFNGAFWYKMKTEKALGMLLYMCHSTLIMSSKVELYVLSKTSQMTIDSSFVINPNGYNGGQGSFSYDTLINEELDDSGYVNWQQDGYPQDTFLSTLVPAKSTTDYISGEEVDMPFIQDSSIAQAMGSLYYQRFLLKKAKVSMSICPSTALALRPDDMITMSGVLYGASTPYDLLVSSIRITRAATIDIDAIRFSYDLDDFDDLSFPAVSVSSDDTTGAWSALRTGDTGVDISRLNAGTAKIITYQNDALGDDEIFYLPDATQGYVFCTCGVEYFTKIIFPDGSVENIKASTNVSTSDVDGDLCIYQSGTQRIIKNRLGSSKNTVCFYFYS